jgi:hypothetical protein
MARPNPAIAQRKSDPHSTQIIVLGRVVAPLASLVVTSTFFDIVGPPNRVRANPTPARLAALCFVIDSNPEATPLFSVRRCLVAGLTMRAAILRAYGPETRRRLVEFTVST